MNTEPFKKDKKQEKIEGNRRNFLKGGILAGIAAGTSALSLTPFASEAHASTNQKKATIDLLAGPVAESYIHKAFAAQDYQQFKEKVISQLTEKVTLKESGAQVFAVSTSLEKVIGVRIPVEGIIDPSFYIAVFDPISGMLIDTRSVLFTILPNKNFKVYAEQMGRVLIDAVITPQGRFVQGKGFFATGQTINLAGKNGQQITEQLKPASVHPNYNPCGNGWWSCINTCFGNYGVPGWIITAIAAVCALGCAITGGAGCLVCLTGVVGGYESVIGACYAYCYNC